MNKICLAAITGAALMAVAGIANAQGTGQAPGSSGTASNQCWDMSSNMVRDKNQTNASGITPPSILIPWLARCADKCFESSSLSAADGGIIVTISTDCDRASNGRTLFENCHYRKSRAYLDDFAGRLL
jgi:hypothetical protein